MTDHTSVKDIQLDPNEVFSALQNEIGVLSGELVVSTLKLKTSLGQINLLSLENENLRKRIITQDSDISSMREQLIDPNHPSKKMTRVKR